VSPVSLVVSTFGAAPASEMPGNTWDAPSGVRANEAGRQRRTAKLLLRMITTNYIDQADGQWRTFTRITPRCGSFNI